MYPSEQAKTFGIFVKNQVLALRDKGMTVDVVAVQNPSMEKPQVIKKYLMWLLQSVLNLLFKGRMYDIVHVHYVFPTGLIGLLYKKLLNKKLIVTAHGGDIDKMAKKSPLTRKWTKTILQEADHIIVVGEELRAKVNEDFEIDSSKVSVINMGVNRSVFTATAKSVAKRYCGIEDNIVPILFVGNIIEQKGIRELVQAYIQVKKAIPNAHLYIMGAKKSQNFSQELELMIQNNTIEDISIYDALPQSELSKWMSAADVFVLPSHIEGFGLVALEAMSCGTPVVGSNVGGLKYLLADGAGMLIEPHNPDSLADGIIKVLNNPSLGNELIEKGEKRAQQNDQDHLIERVLQVYSPPGG